MASVPLGSVRGEEGLTIWEYAAFQSACSFRYRSGDEERERSEEEMFEWHQQFEENYEQFPDDCSDCDNESTYDYNTWNDDEWKDDDNDDKDVCKQTVVISERSRTHPTATATSSLLSGQSSTTTTSTPSLTWSREDPFANVRFPKPVRWAPGPKREPNLVPACSFINSSNDHDLKESR
jgi:hypothetical protein